MRPMAIRKGPMVRGPDGLLRLEMVDAGGEGVLDPFAEPIWDLCDGTRTIESLADAAGQNCNRTVPREEVFSALDFLADAGLIEQRGAPPVAEANVSRRALLARIAPVLGAAACRIPEVSANAGVITHCSEPHNHESSSQ